jgi:hypothetical protein
MNHVKVGKLYVSESGTMVKATKVVQHPTKKFVGAVKIGEVGKFSTQVLPGTSRFIQIDSLRRRYAEA